MTVTLSKSTPRIGRRGYAALAATLRDTRAAPKLRRIFVDYPKAASAMELRAACEARGIWLVSPIEADRHYRRSLRDP